ncbi:hypothetical protein Q5752_003048 [Cryptotrichosporon argae]
MPPRASSRAPNSSAKPANKPASRAPASRKPASRAAAAPLADVDADGDVNMSNGDVPNGHAMEPKAEVKEPAKRKGRVAELARDKRRRSSVGTGFKNEIAQAPPVSVPGKTVFVFGTGDMGQFGTGPDDLDEKPRPQLHTKFEELREDGELARDGKPGSGGLEAIACGGMHTLAIDEAGHVRSWGINDNAALGRETANVPDPAKPGSTLPAEDFETWPLVVPSLAHAGFRAVKVAAGDSVSVALSDKGELRAWGSFRSNEGVLGFDGVPGHPKFQYTPLALPSLAKVAITSVSCGADHVLALAATGHVYVWGNGQQNQLGRRIISRRPLSALEPERLGLRNITLVAAGMYHSFAVDANGTVWAWGLNTFRQTGIAARRGGDDEMVAVPTQVDALDPAAHAGARVVDIAGGEHHSLFLFDNGEVWATGRCDASELGLGPDHPAQEGIQDRRAAMQHEREANVESRTKRLDALKAKGADEAAIAAAENELTEAQASLRVPMGEYVPEPVRVMFPPVPESYEVVPAFPTYAEAAAANANPIAHISAGTRHNLAVSASGHVYAWGLGNQAQLGLGADTETADVPTLVRSKQLRPYRAVAASAGGQHCVLLAQGKDE